MHVPDHVLNDGTVIAAATASAGVVAYAAWRSRRDVGGGKLLMAAGVTGFVFAAQMVNFPVAAGTSGHVIGAALAVALLGPWLAVVSMSVVLAVQALVFADGGAAALGVNVLLMAIVPVAVSWAILELLRARRRGRVGLTVSIGIAAAVSVPAAAVVFSGLYAVGGEVPAPIGELLAAMVSVHTWIGAGEAVATMLVVAVVVTWSPGAAWAHARPAQAPGVRRGVAGGLVGGSLALTVMAAIASSAPDGLESVGLRFGFGSGPAFAWSPLADYGGASGVPPTVAGVIGVALCLAAWWASSRLVAGPARIVGEA